MLTLTGLEMGGRDYFSCLEWKLGGIFGLLTCVKDVIHSPNDKRGVFCGYLAKI